MKTYISDASEPTRADDKTAEAMARRLVWQVFCHKLPTDAWPKLQAIAMERRKLQEAERELFGDLIRAMEG
jgi:hypothetical protein